jgi:hypothetical protein
MFYTTFDQFISTTPKPPGPKDYLVSPGTGPQIPYHNISTALSRKRTELTAIECRRCDVRHLFLRFHISVVYRYTMLIQQPTCKGYTYDRRARKESRCMLHACHRVCSVTQCQMTETPLAVRVT